MYIYRESSAIHHLGWWTRDPAPRPNGPTDQLSQPWVRPRDPAPPWTGPTHLATPSASALPLPCRTSSHSPAPASSRVQRPVSLHAGWRLAPWRIGDVHSGQICSIFSIELQPHLFGSKYESTQINQWATRIRLQIENDSNNWANSRNHRVKSGKWLTKISRMSDEM
jgi:hypothetical protein